MAKSLFKYILYLLGVGFIILNIVGSHHTNPSKVNGILVARAYTKGSDYSEVYYNNTLYVVNNMSGSSKAIKEYLGTVTANFQLTGGYAVAKYSYIEGTSIPDPGSMSIGVDKYLPHAYTSSIKSESIYLKTLEYDGWVIDGYFSDPTYLDLYFKKDNQFCRVIFMNKQIEIFWKIQEKIPNALTYIIDKTTGE